MAKITNFPIESLTAGIVVELTNEEAKAVRAYIAQLTFGDLRTFSDETVLGLAKIKRSIEDHHEVKETE